MLVEKFQSVGNIYAQSCKEEGRGGEERAVNLCHTSLSLPLSFLLKVRERDREIEREMRS